MIIVTASTSPGAVSSNDHIINLNTGDTLPDNINIYASAVDSEDGSANFSFSWHLLRKPEGSAAVLDQAQVQNTLVNDVDTWGDYRLFCIATNVASGATSEADPIKAPNSAFCQIRVRSLNLALVKPAPGERDWFSYAYEWVDALEALDPVVDDHETRITTLEAHVHAETLDSLTDVTLSTPVDGQALVYNASTGEWENGTISTGATNLELGDSTQTFSMALETGRLNFFGTSNEVEVSGVNSVSGAEFTFGLPAQVSITDTLTVGGALTAQDELIVQSDTTVADIYVSGKVLDSDSPNTYLLGKADGWYMSDNGTAGAECKLLTRCQAPGTTTNTRGGVIQSSDKWSGYNSGGALPSVHILTFSQQSEHSVYTNSPADQPHVDSNEDTINANQSGSTQITPHEHIIFCNQSGGDISIEEISLVVMAGGDVQGQPYVFELTRYDTLADFLSQNRINTGVQITLNQNQPWYPAVGELASSSITVVPPGGYFGFRCVQSAKIEGHRLIANVTAIRMI